MTLFNRLRAILLMLVLLPLLTVATTPRPVSAQAIPRYLKLVSLTAHQTEESSGDEPYITFYGVTAWSGNLSTGQTANLSGVPARQMSGDAVMISLYEDDWVWPDSDDWLGTYMVYSDAAGKGYRTAYFSGPGWYYTLTYYVY